MQPIGHGFAKALIECGDVQNDVARPAAAAAGCQRRAADRATWNLAPTDPIPIIAAIPTLYLAEEATVDGGNTEER
jgi:hypothetical protein